MLGVDKMTCWRWLLPNSGTPETSHPPDNTYMIPPRRDWIPRPDEPTPDMSPAQRKKREALIREWDENDGLIGAPHWVKSDVERFAVEIGRQRRPAGQAEETAATS